MVRTMISKKNRRPLSAAGRRPRPGYRPVGVLLALLLAFGLKADRARAQENPGVAVVVHPETDVADLSSAQLRNIFMAEQQFWPDRSRITLLVRAPVSYERDIVLEIIYRMDEGQFRQYWIAKMFRAEVASGPKIVYTNDMARELVTVIKGAITFVRADDVGPGMKVVRIDGKLPADPGYPLR